MDVEGHGVGGIGGWSPDVEILLRGPNAAARHAREPVNHHRKASPCVLAGGMVPAAVHIGARVDESEWALHDRQVSLAASNRCPRVWAHNRQLAVGSSLGFFVGLMQLALIALTS